MRTEPRLAHLATVTRCRGNPGLLRNRYRVRQSSVAALLQLRWAQALQPNRNRNRNRRSDVVLPLLVLCVRPCLFITVLYVCAVYG